MLKRLTHAAIAFAAVVAVYQIYVLAAVPFLEPDWNSQAVVEQSSSDQPDVPRVAVHKYLELLAAYFPADHWCLQQQPKPFESGRVMVVLDD